MLLKSLVCLLEGDDTDVFYGECPECASGVVVSGNDLRRGNIVCSKCDAPAKEPPRQLRTFVETYVSPTRFNAQRDVRKPIFAAVAAVRQERKRRRRRRLSS